MARRTRAPRAPSPHETDFMRAIMLAIGALPGLRIWRQNVGQIPVRDRTGKVVRTFDPGPPNGAADLSGLVRPEGWRLEIEVKSATGKRDAEQIRWADFITASGGVYALVAYDAELSTQENVARASRVVLEAIAERRAR